LLRPRAVGTPVRPPGAPCPLPTDDSQTRKNVSIELGDLLGDRALLHPRLYPLKSRQPQDAANQAGPKSCDGQLVVLASDCLVGVVTSAGCMVGRWGNLI
jgi:hypothetical protein